MKKLTIFLLVVSVFLQSKNLVAARLYNQGQIEQADTVVIKNELPHKIRLLQKWEHDMLSNYVTFFYFIGVGGECSISFSEVPLVFNENGQGGYPVEVIIDDGLNTVLKYFLFSGENLMRIIKHNGLYTIENSI